MGQHPTITLEMQSAEIEQDISIKNALARIPIDDAELPYQRPAREQLIKLRKAAVIAPMGAGKTRIICTALLEHGLINYELLQKYPILVIGSGASLPAWYKQIPQWTGYTESKIHVVSGSGLAREQVWRRLLRLQDGGVFIINYSVFLRDRKILEMIPWSCVIADEYHKTMRSKETKTYAAFKRITYEVPYLFMVSGTPARKHPGSMWTMFNIIAPKVFTSYWRFVNTYCVTVTTQFGVEIIGPKNVQGLHKIMCEFTAYIPKEVVASYLPKGRRDIITIEMTDYQAKVYKKLCKEMICELDNKQLIVTPTILARIVKFRQLLCCPKTVDPTTKDIGGALEYILDTFDDDDHIVIFVPFRDAVTCIQQDLVAAGHKNVFALMGGISVAEANEQRQLFRETKGIMLCTVQYAESFDLETCKTSWFNGYDYSLDVNEQAEGRTQRAISKSSTVFWHYLQYQDTVDMDFLAALHHDYRNMKRIYERPQALIEAMKRGMSI